MKLLATTLFFLVTLFAACLVIAATGEPATPKTGGQTAKTTATDTQEKNIQEYIVLLRENLRDEKGQILGEVMQFNVGDAAKFWPIYNEYDSELNKLNDLRLQNIRTYARDFSQMTDEKADRLTKQAFDFQRQRADLLQKYYERVKQSLGATTAARFLQVENQMLSIMDLQIDGSLPVVG